jgi:hypothetical protein
MKANDADALSVMRVAGRNNLEGLEVKLITPTIEDSFICLMNENSE